MLGEDSPRAVNLVRHLGGKGPKGACANFLKDVGFVAMHGKSELVLRELQTSCFAETVTEFSFPSSNLFAPAGVIKNGSFDSMPNLEFIEISGNEINVIEPGAFSELSKIYLLQMRENNLSDMQSLHSAICHLKALKYLYLSGNNFTEITSKSGGALSFSDLRHLELNRNSIRSLGTGDFSGMPLLKDFDCEYCDLETIAKDTFLTNAHLNRLCLKLGNTKLNWTATETWGIQDETLSERLRSVAKGVDYAC